MLKIGYNSDPTSHQTQQRICDYIVQQRHDRGRFRVIDIGGWIHGWSAPVIDMLVDINTENTAGSLRLDICQDSAWAELEQHTRETGMYDYAICTHTLEDLYNPVAALRFLPKIARAGVITMPSAHHELSRHENPAWTGYIHHRWVFDQTSTGDMLLVPKLPALDGVIAQRDLSNPNRMEIEYQWSEHIPFTMFMNNFLGPNVGVVHNEFAAFVARIEQERGLASQPVEPV